MKHRPTRIPLLLLLILLLGGCQTIQERKSVISLENTLDAYGKVARWGQIAQLYEFLSPELAGDVTLPRGLDNVRVTGYEVLKAPVKIDETHAVQTVSISYILRDRQVQHSLLDRQEWVMDPEKKLWYRSNPIPPFE